jgi:hypothetical protein
MNVRALKTELPERPSKPMAECLQYLQHHRVRLVNDRMGFGASSTAF